MKYYVLNSKFTTYSNEDGYFINKRKIDKDSSGEIIDNKEEYLRAKSIEFYQNYFSNQFENLVVLSGAGTSVKIGKNGKVGKMVAELWDEAVIEIKGTDIYTIEELCSKVNYPVVPSFEKINEKNIEKLLSLSQNAKDFNTADAKISNTIDAIEKLIKDKCSLILPDDGSQHLAFLNKLIKRKLKLPRVKIFTLNYDTLFEQAARKGRFVVIDGFSFTHPRKFEGTIFNYDVTIREKSRINEEENYIPKLIHLYKIHGSLDWEKQPNGDVIQKETDHPLMIYPKSNKYEYSYDQPFFEMMSRFQQEIRKENTLLICLGFSFGDKHLVTAINEALYSNSSFRLAIVTLNIESISGFEEYKKLSESQSNLILIEEDFATFATNFPEISVYNNQ